jgi:hypothetical protein
MVSSKEVNIAQYLNLSCTGFYPLVNILGIHRNTDEYNANAAAIHGNIMIGIVASSNRPRIKPPINAKLHNMINLLSNCYYNCIHANKYPIIYII